MPEMSFRYRESGPLLSRTARRVASRRYAEDVERETAEEAKQRVDARLARVLRHPTGYYQSRIRVQKVRGRWEVNDSDVIYGPWLGGTGSRNYPVTIFPGYATFRTVYATMDRRVQPIADRVWQTSGRRRFT